VDAHSVLRRPRELVYELGATERDDLIRRIRDVRLPDTRGLEPWRYGVDAGYLRELLDAWSAFDWDAWLAVVNRHPHYLVELDGIDLHFRRAGADGTGRTPLVLLHGWPGSYLEFDRIAPALVDAGFDLVIPSLPGTGFSTVTRPMTKQRMAAIVDALMTEILGHDRYAVHGGDIGSGIATRLGYHHGEHLIGIHVTFLMSEPPALERVELSADERLYLDELAAWHEEEGAYTHLQRTKPLTLGYALDDSPVGLLAWLVDKYRSWSDCGGDVESRFTRFELLTYASLYWFTGTIASSMSLYFDNRHRTPLPPGARVEVPTAVALFPNELVTEGHAPRELAERTFDVARWRTHASGGHFVALEEPDVLARDIVEFFSTLTGA
jgi:pimeloyl-ACP methyl ester carboxylesterase